MRLSTLQIYQQGIDTILTKQAELQQIQEQIASGSKVLNPSDDPVAAVKILDISEDLALIESYARNGSTAQSQLALEETVLQDVNTTLQRIRELVVQANNATQTSETRDSIAAEIEVRFDELLSLANTRDANDEYIFAGFQTESQPFTLSGDQVTYNGDDGQRFLQLAAGSQIAVRDSGSDVFLSAPAGNGSFSIAPDAANTGTAIIKDNSATNAYVRDDYTLSFSQTAADAPVLYQVTDSASGVVSSGTYSAQSGIEFNGGRVVLEGVPEDGDSFNISSQPHQDIFATVQGILTSLTGSGDDPASKAAVNNAMANGLQNIDQAMGNILQVQTEVGGRLNRIETQLDNNEDFALQLQQSLSDIQDIDYADAISKLNLQLVALEAAQQSYVKVQGLSLFNYL